MSREDSPIRKARKSLSPPVSLQELATRTGLSMPCIQNVEVGITKKLNAPLLAFFSSRGIDTDELQRDYAEYRKALQAL